MDQKCDELVKNKNIFKSTNVWTEKNVKKQKKQKKKNENQITRLGSTYIITISYWWLSSKVRYTCFFLVPNTKNNKFCSHRQINNRTTIWPPIHFLWPARTAGGNLRDISSSKIEKKVSKFQSKSVFWTNFFFFLIPQQPQKTSTSLISHNKLKRIRPQILYIYMKFAGTIYKKFQKTKSNEETGTIKIRNQIECFLSITRIIFWNHHKPINSQLPTKKTVGRGQDLGRS